MADEKTNVSEFISNLYRCLTLSRSLCTNPRSCSQLVSDPTSNDIIEWSRTGDEIIVKDENAFTTTLLPQYFRASNYASFVRQLNLYGFSKRQARFFHASFHRDHPEWLHLIRRKQPGGTQSTSAVSNKASQDSSSSRQPSSWREGTSNRYTRSTAANNPDHQPQSFSMDYPKPPSLRQSSPPVDQVIPQSHPAGSGAEWSPPSNTQTGQLEDSHQDAASMELQYGRRDTPAHLYQSTVPDYGQYEGYGTQHQSYAPSRAPKSNTDYLNETIEQLQSQINTLSRQYIELYRLQQQLLYIISTYFGMDSNAYNSFNDSSRYGGSNYMRDRERMYSNQGSASRPVPPGGGYSRPFFPQGGIPPRSVQPYQPQVGGLSGAMVPLGSASPGPSLQQPTLTYHHSGMGQYGGGLSGFGSNYNAAAPNSAGLSDHLRNSMGALGSGPLPGSFNPLDFPGAAFPPAMNQNNFNNFKYQWNQQQQQQQPSQAAIQSHSALPLLEMAPDIHTYPVPTQPFEPATITEVTPTSSEVMSPPSPKPVVRSSSPSIIIPSHPPSPPTDTKPPVSSSLVSLSPGAGLGLSPRITPPNLNIGLSTLVPDSTRRYGLGTGVGTTVNAKAGPAAPSLHGFSNLTNFGTSSATSSFPVGQGFGISNRPGYPNLSRAPSPTPSRPQSSSSPKVPQSPFANPIAGINTSPATMSPAFPAFPVGPRPIQHTLSAMNDQAGASNPTPKNL